MSAAPSKGAAAAAWESNSDYDASDLIEQRMPGGISVWSLGSVACIIESLGTDAPAPYVEIIRQRVWANLSGRCPVCDAVADVRTAGRGAMRHDERCSVGYPPAGMARYIDPASTAYLRAASTGIHTKGNTT